MFKRLKMWMYLAAVTGGCLLGGGCLGFSTALDNLPRIITAILREDLFS